MQDIKLVVKKDLIQCKLIQEKTMYKHTHQMRNEAAFSIRWCYNTLRKSPTFETSKVEVYLMLIAPQLHTSIYRELQKSLEMAVLIS